MSYLNALLSDLRDKKLWPLAVALLAGLVAVPVLLSKSPTATPPPALPSTGLPVASNTGAAVVVNASPTQATLSGKGRDPFTQQVNASSASSSSCAARFLDKAACAAMSSAATSGTGGASPSGASSGTTGSGTTGSGTTGSGSTVSPVLPANPAPVHHGPAPSVFTSLDAYHVSLAITNAAGGVNAIDPLLRDSALPSDSQPLLVEVGVLQGGKRAIFYVQPGSVVGGPGTCIPGPVDCEILSLGVGQTESVKPAGSSSSTLFQVTDIYVDRYATAAQASLARAHVDARGRNLLANSISSTLALFQYDPTLDAVVDMRNLTVGGN